MNKNATLSQIKLLSSIVKSEGRLRGSSITIDLSSMNEQEVNAFLKKHKLVLDPASKKQRTPWYRYIGPNGEKMEVEWGDGYAKIELHQD